MEPERIVEILARHVACDCGYKPTHCQRCWGDVPFPCDIHQLAAEATRLRQERDAAEAMHAALLEVRPTRGQLTFEATRYREALEDIEGGYCEKHRDRHDDCARDVAREALATGQEAHRG